MAELNLEALARDLAGSRASARVPVSRALLNRLIADGMAGRNLPVRTVDVRPRAGDRFEVVVTVSWPFVPALTVAVLIDKQPDFPSSPFLVLRWSFLGAAGMFASRLISAFGRLPDGIHLDGDRLLLDIPRLAAPTAAAAALPYVSALELHTLEGRAVVDLEMAVPEATS